MAKILRRSGVFNLGSLGGDGPDTVLDADFDSVVLLLDGEITDKSSSTHTITTNGDTRVDATVKKFGSGSIEFDGATDHLSATSSSDFTFGTGDFTIEAWVKFRNGASDRDMTLFDNGTVNTPGHLCIFADVNNLYCRFGPSGASLNTSWTTLGMSNNNWNHLAIVRDSGTCRVFVNGVQKNSGTRSENLTATGCRIGTLSGYEAFYAFDGYLDDYRITKGVARYTSNFNPPTSDLTNTVLGGTVELRMDGTDGSGSGSTTTDLSDEAHTGITSTDVTAGTTDAGVTRPDLYGGAKGYLDFTSSQAGRIVTLPTTVDLSSGDFTIECWVLFDTISDYRSFMRGGSGTSASGSWQLQTYGSKISFLIGGASTYSITDSKTVTTNTWYHVALSYVSSTYTMTLSVDGVVTTLTDQTEFSNMQSSYLGGSGTNIELGANRGGTVRHDGLLTDVRFTTGVALYPDLGRTTPIPTAALPTPVAGATRPTRKWGGMTGRSIFNSTTLDADFDSVVLLLDGDGTSGSTTFTDKSSASHIITVNGDTQVDTTVKKFGAGSIEFDGTGDYLDVSVDARLTFDGDFTVEAWVYPDTTGSYQPIIDARASNIAYQNYYFGLANVGGTLRTEVILASGATGRTGTTNAVPTGQWSHIAWVRNSGVITTYVNGVADATTKTDSATLTPTNFRIGAAVGTPNAYFDGYLDDIRVTKGVARYSSSFFTPPTSALSADVSDITGSDDVVLLLDGDNNITDRSSSGHTMSWPVSAAYQSFGKFNQALDLTSTYLNGPTTTETSDFQFGTDDFTLESWIYWPSGIPTTDKCLFDSRTAANDAGLVWFFPGNTSSTLVHRVYNSGGLRTASSAGSLSLNAWHHVALVRKGNTFTYFTDGQSVGSFTFTGSVNQTASNPLRIGTRVDANFGIQGYIDDFRVTKGAALYPFHPPASALPTTGTVTTLPNTGILSLAEHYQSKL